MTMFKGIEIKQDNAGELRDELFNVINNAPNVYNVEYINVDKCGFSRKISFDVSDKTYKIEWMWNQSTLFMDGDVEIIFDKCFAIGTWPNRYRTNLQFYHKDTPICIIPIENY